jgi:hypothetical protein
MAEARRSDEMRSSLAIRNLELGRGATLARTGPQAAAKTTVAARIRIIE